MASSSSQLKSPSVPSESDQGANRLRSSTCAREHTIFPIL